MVRSDQTRIPAAFVRGGTSNAVFFHKHDIPPPGPLRDRVLKRAMGTPDPLQIDGMGGTKAVTSKIAIISPSERPDADVDYTFAQASVAADTIGYEANCGNISAGVGPFAIEEGLVKDFREGQKLDNYQGRTQEVRIYNTGTKRNLISNVPIGDDGYPVATGDYKIAGVPGTGAPILLDYSETAGASEDKGLLPSGNALDQVEIGGKKVGITLCDVANICVFAKAEDFGISGQEYAAALTDNAVLIASVRELRGKAAQLIGMCKDWEKVDEQSPFMPMPVLVAPPPTSDGDVSGRLFLDNMCHESMAGTGSVCFTACSRVAGSVVNRIISTKAQQAATFRIAHPRGVIPVVVEVDQTTARTSDPVFKTLSFVRTARRLMDGHIYVPKDVYDPTRTSLNINGAQTNGHSSPKAIGAPANGHSTPKATNGSHEKQSHEMEVPVTRILSDFIASVDSAILTQELREKLKEVIIDYLGVVIGGSKNAPSSESIIKGAINLGAKTNQDNCTVITLGNGFGAAYAGFLNSTFGHSMDFDDTYADGSLHAGVTAIAAAMTQAELLGDSANSDKFLSAVAVGYEVTCRIGRELGFEAYSRGFHNTSTAGIFGAISSIAVLKGLTSRVIEMAFGLAGSKAAGSMQYLDNGSWNKRLHAGFAVHDAFVCVALAEAGVLGSTKAIEGHFGFLNAYSPNTKKDLSRLTSDLGRTWVWQNTALKPFPACRMTHCFIEMAGDMGQAAGNKKEVKSIKLQLTPANYSIVGQRTTNKLHAENTVDAQFSAFYQTANAWLYGSNTGLQTYDRLGQADINALCDKIECKKYDTEQKPLAGTLDVEYSDGSSDSRHLDYPLGEAQHPFTRDRVDLKFFGLVDPVYGSATARQIRDMVDNIENESVQALLGLIAQPKAN